MLDRLRNLWSRPWRIGRSQDRWRPESELLPGQVDGPAPVTIDMLLESLRGFLTHLAAAQKSGQDMSQFAGNLVLRLEPGDEILANVMEAKNNRLVIEIHGTTVAGLAHGLQEHQAPQREQEDGLWPNQPQQ